MRLNQVMRRVCSWMYDHGLELAEAKTEIVLLTKRHINASCLMRVGDATVQIKKTTKYLGMMLDNKLTFGEHVLKATDKAAAVTSMLSRVMANINGPHPCMRHLLMRTANRLCSTERMSGLMRCGLKNTTSALQQCNGGEHSISCSPTVQSLSPRY